MNHELISFRAALFGATFLASACSKPAPAPEATAKSDVPSEAGAEAMIAPEPESKTAEAVPTADQQLAAAPTEPCFEASESPLFGAVYSGADDGSFTFWTSETRVGYQHPDTKMAELWVRSNDTDVSFERWFFEDKRSIEYMSGDLKTIGRPASWEAVSNPVPGNVFSQLRAGKVGTWRCLEAQAYAGEVHGSHWELVWLPALKIPAAFSRRGENGELEQRELTTLESSEAARAFFNKRTEFDSMDFADIGDNESDPFVRKAIENGLVEHAEHPGKH